MTDTPTCTHCWHYSSYHSSTLMTRGNFHKRGVVCCKCNAQGIEKSHDERIIPPGHGKFYPDETRVIDEIHWVSDGV